MSDPKNENTSGISILSEDDFSELAIPHPAIVMSTPPEDATTNTTSPLQGLKPESATTSTTSPLEGLKAAINKQPAQTLPPLQPIGGKQPVQPVAVKPAPLQPIGGKQLAQPIQPTAVKPSPLQALGNKVRPTTPQPTASVTSRTVTPTVTPAKPAAPVTPASLQAVKAEETKPVVEPAKVETTKIEEVKPVTPVTPAPIQAVKAEETKPAVEPAKVETTKTEEVKPATPVTPAPIQAVKAEETKPVVEPAKVETPKTEEVKPVTPVTPAPVQAVKTEETKPAVAEPAKVETPKTEEVKPATPVAPTPVQTVKAEETKPAIEPAKAEEKPATTPKASILTDGKINDKKVPMIAPPAMLGILGGGQLGRFFAMAAKRMGYQVTVLDPDPNAPAAAFADEHICAAYDDKTALEKLAQCAAVTTEFENVNAAAMVQLAQKTRVTPAGELVAIAQNRIDEKAAIRKASLPVTPYQAIRSREDLNANTKQLLPGILKTATLGYDGKGQRTVKTQTGLLTSLSSLAKDGPYILEKALDLTAELSVIVCRLDNNVVVTFPPAENIHDNGILAFTIVPARLPEELLKRAEVMAKHLAEKLDYVGVLAVEMFVVGEKQQLVVNEIAPRPHNSGHYTLDACVSDQFQQQVRIMCGLPPSRTSLIHPCCMVNLLGDIWGEDGKEPDWSPLLKNPDTFLHLYGKKQARPGRKMGHFTVFAETADAAYEKAQNLFTSVCLGS